MKRLLLPALLLSLAGCGHQRPTETPIAMPTPVAEKTPLDAGSAKVLAQLSSVAGQVQGQEALYKQVNDDGAKFLSDTSPAVERMAHAGDIAKRMTQVNKEFAADEQEFGKVEPTARTLAVVRAYSSYLHGLVVQTGTYIQYANMCKVKEPTKNPKFLDMAHDVLTTTKQRDSYLNAFKEQVGILRDSDPGVR
jgi:hypothetical protein